MSGRGRLIAVRSDLGTREIGVTSVADDPIGVKVTIEFFTAAIATPVKDKDDNNGGKGGNPSGNSANNRTGIAARTRGSSRYNDNCRLNGGSEYRAIGFCRSDKNACQRRRMSAVKLMSVHEFRGKHRSQRGTYRGSTRALGNLVCGDCDDIRSSKGASGLCCSRLGL